ncbi:U32 family peptidase [Candidatus Woesearchaeota archaeon]|nr:U32 family peptidase [Candidatus Woesearchaeota archaeon]
MTTLLSPAGSFESLRAAIKAGADAVYFGVGTLNMRSKSHKLQLDDLEEIANICKEAKVKSCLTLNTVMYDNDLDSIKSICDRAKAAGINAIIACDFAVINYCNSINLPVHLSTQANVSNIEAVKFYSRYADVIVLARELSLDQIATICKEIKQQKITGPSGNPIQIEVFIHGALCVSISGKCYMSLAQYNTSANRGACLQACRRQYNVTDEETGDELQIDNKFVMSPKDLCTIGMMDKLIAAGPTVFKIEGRARGPEYVFTVTKAYREAIDAVHNHTFTKEKADQWRTQLATVFNRGFWEDGYYMGKPAGEWAGIYGSKATKEKVQVGKVTNYFAKQGVAEIYIDSGDFRVGDTLLITGPTTGALYVEVEEIKQDDKPTGCGIKGKSVTITVPEKVRENDKVFLITERRSTQ